jgi:ATP-binding cassette subfamily B protein
LINILISIINILIKNVISKLKIQRTNAKQALYYDHLTNEKNRLTSEYRAIKNRIGVSSPEEIEMAARNANIYDEIMEFPEGFNTIIGERGVTLSGGQKQRISIARAMLKNPEILIFDDCLSAVDAKTEQLILNNLAEVLKDKTAIIITHRIFSLLAFDLVIVIDDGNIIEQGTHDDLVKKNGYYAELYRKQQASSIEKTA